MLALAGVATAGACGGGDDDAESGAGAGGDTSEQDVPAGELGEAAGGITTTTTAPPTTTTTAPPGPLPFASASAPTTAADGVDACQATTSYSASRLIDGAPDTAWRMDGDGSGQTLTLTLSGEHRVREVGLVPGYNKVDPCDGADRFVQNRRPTSVTWLFDDGTQATQTLSDVRQLQTVSVDATTTTVRLRLDGVTGSPERDFTAISEVTARGN